jgi:hypothetical protein
MLSILTMSILWGGAQAVRETPDEPPDRQGTGT